MLRIKKFYTDYFTFVAQRSRAMESCVYESCIGLLLILVDSFSGWPEVIRVPDKNAL